MSTSVAPAASAPAPLSEAARLANAFVEPTATFTDLRRKAGFVAPWLLISVVALAFAFAAGQKIGWSRMAETQLELAPKRAAQMDTLAPAQRARAMAISVQGMKIAAYGMPFIILAVCAVIAGLLLVTFNAAFGISVRYGTAFSVVMYATLPEVLRFGLAVVFLYTGVASPDTFILQNPVASNAAGFLTPGTAMYTMGLFADAFKIWSLVLTAIGFACVSKLKRGSTFAVVFGWYFVLALVQTGIAAAFS